MTKHNIIWTFVLAFIMIVGCEKDNSNHDESYIQTQTMGPVTLSLGKVTATTAEFAVELDVNMMADYQEVGYLFSQDDDLDIDNPSVKKIQVNREKYQNTFTGLLFDTNYNYTVYTLRNNVYSYGSIQSFKTKDIVVDIENISVRYTDVAFACKLLIDEEDTGIYVGIMCAEDTSFTDAIVKVVEDTKQIGDFSLLIDGLMVEQQYYFRTFVRQGNHFEYGEVLSFTTMPEFPVSLSLASVGIHSANFIGRVGPLADYGGIEIAVLLGYSESVNNSNYQYKYVLRSDEIDETGAFNVAFSDLKCDEVYYYTCCISCSLSPCIPVKEFSTPEMCISLVEGHLTDNYLELEGKLGYHDTDFLYDFFVLISSTDPLPTLDSSSVWKITGFYERGWFTLRSDGEYPEDVYYCRLCMKDSDSNIYYGDIIKCVKEN